MCTATAGPRTRGALPRPSWGALYALVLVLLAALLGVEASRAPKEVGTVLESGVVVVASVLTGLWLRQNRAALDLQEWCVCASEHVTVRVIPSHRATRLRPTPVGPWVVVAERVDEAYVGRESSTRLDDLRRD
jgi:hypothetical protein